jgi:hypothetical protein
MRFKCYNGFLNKLKITCTNPPFGDFVMPVMFDLPSNVDRPTVLAFEFIANDWI